MSNDPWERAAAAQQLADEIVAAVMRPREADDEVIRAHLRMEASFDRLDACYDRIDRLLGELIAAVERSRLTDDEH